jgi:hypothetical protein
MQATQPIGSSSSHSSVKSSIGETVWNTAKLIAKIATALFLYYINPPLFALGFLIGVIFPEKMEETVAKIQRIWNKQPLPMMLILGFGAILSLPVFLASSSMIVGGYVGCQMSKENS